MREELVEATYLLNECERLIRTTMLDKTTIRLYRKIERFLKKVEVMNVEDREEHTEIQKESSST